MEIGREQKKRFLYRLKQAFKYSFIFLNCIE